MADSDIKLGPGQVIAQALDLCLDSQDPARRHNDSPHRRALVHDYGDGLTINWDQDYPGGVTIWGKVRVKYDPASVVLVDPNKTMASPPGPRTLVLVDQILSLIRVVGELRQELAAAKEALAQAQENWRWCPNCYGLWFAGNPNNQGVCPADPNHGPHSQQGSGTYRLLR
jgi:hypothetical protein